tara:strand:+ start:93 stop:533 length:441 start_codon:yes stop_codon:yes gene_type:complete
MAIRTSPYTAAELRQLLAQLERASVVVREATEFVEETGNSIFVFNKASQVDGMRRLRSFERELSDSLVASKSGTAFDADTLKSRAVSPPISEELAKMRRATDIPTSEPIDTKTVKKQAKRASKKKASRESASKKTSNQVSSRRKQG